MDDDVPDDDIKIDPDAGSGYERLTVEPLCIIENNLSSTVNNSSSSNITPKKRRGRPPKVRNEFDVDATSASHQPANTDEYTKDDYDDNDDNYVAEAASTKQKKLTKKLKIPKVKREPREPKQPEQCEVCGFISRSLKSHMMTHTQERNYECDFCGKKFSLRASLKNHLFAHINIR